MEMTEQRSFEMERAWIPGSPYGEKPLANQESLPWCVKRVRNKFLRYLDHYAFGVYLLLLFSPIFMICTLYLALDLNQIAQGAD